MSRRADFGARRPSGALAGAERRGGRKAASTTAPPRSAQRRKAGALQKSIEAATDIVPLWVAESMVQEVSVWLGVVLPEDWPAALAAKAERCFARHEQFHRLISALGAGGNAGIANLRRFMRHWLASRLKRERLPLFRRLPWSYALGVAPRTVRVDER